MVLIQFQKKYSLSWKKKWKIWIMNIWLKLWPINKLAFFLTWFWLGSFVCQVKRRRWRLWMQNREHRQIQQLQNIPSNQDTHAKRLLPLHQSESEQEVRVLATERRQVCPEGLSSWDVQWRGLAPRLQDLLQQRPEPCKF